MIKKNSKLWIICIGFALLVLCFSIGASSMFYVFAEGSAFEQTQAIEDKMLLKDVNVLTSETKDSDDKSEYVNLGNSRLSEGDQGLTQLHYIENANYFLANPNHRENNKESGDHPFGTCTTVAHQILLGYHNYYSDRRLIPEISSDGERYLDENYGDLNLDPVFEHDPAGTGLGRSNIGTEDAVFYGIFNKAGGSSLLSQTIGNVANAADEFLEDCASGRTKNWTITNSNYNQQEVVAELDAGRPVILGFDIFGGHSSHVVVAYGYATYDEELCYITHYGWSSTSVQMLVPESWLGYQVTMNVDHEHDFDAGSIFNSAYAALHCTTCDCDQIDEAYLLNETGEIITQCKHDLAGEVAIPSQINGQTITGIAANAFANQTEITQISLPNTVTSIANNAFSDCTSLTTVSGINNVQSIGEYAFKNCDALTSIAIPAGTTYIGDGAFAGCNNLNISVSTSNPNYSAEGNILYNKNKTELLQACEIGAELIIADTVQTISAYAFEENNNIGVIYLNQAMTIESYAFANCENLGSIYIGTSDPISIQENAFQNNIFTVFVLYGCLDEYETLFSGYNATVKSLEVQITFVYGKEVVSTQTIYVGEQLSDLPQTNITGMRFLGWYDNPECTGEPYRDGDYWNLYTGLILYAKTEPETYTVFFDPNGGTIIGSSIMEVEYGSTFSTQTSAEKEGNVLLGWFDSEGTRYITEEGECTRTWDKAANTTLYAHWSVEEYEIRINGDGTITWLGEEGFSDEQCSIPYGAEIDAINLIYVFKNSSQGFRPGMIFEYFTYEGETIDWASIPDLGEDGQIITIIPVWEKEEHTIYFNAMCDIAVDEIVALYDDEISLEVLQMEDYDFCGWYTEANGEGEKVEWVRMPDLTPDEQKNGSIMLYAFWEPIYYTVRYNANGGSGVMDDSIFEYGVAKELRKNIFVRTGHDFIGWATSSDGSAIYTDEESVILASPPVETVYLYAVWQAKIYSITYKNLMSNMVIYPQVNTYTYGVGLSEMPTILLNGEEYSYFYGWYSSTSWNESGKITYISSSETGNIIVYAKYDYYLSTTYGGGVVETVTDDDIYDQPSYDIWVYLNSLYYNQISGTTLNKVKITISMTLWELDDGYQLYKIYNEAGNEIWYYEHEHGPGHKDTSHESFETTIYLNIEDVKAFNYLTLRFWARGSGADDWQFTDFTMSVYFTN